MRDGWATRPLQVGDPLGERPFHPEGPNGLTRCQRRWLSGATGVEMGPPKSMGAKACQWRQPVKPGSPGAIVDVTIIDLNGYSIGKKSAGTFTITAVGSVGDEAYYSESSDGKLTSLRVRKGSSAFAVHVWGGPMPAAEAKPITGKV